MNHNYKDFSHYGNWINDKITEYIAEDKNRITIENYQTVIQNMKDYIHAYDFETIFEYNPACAVRFDSCRLQTGGDTPGNHRPGGHDTSELQGGIYGAGQNRQQSDCARRRHTLRCGAGAGRLHDVWLGGRKWSAGRAFCYGY